MCAKSPSHKAHMTLVQNALGQPARQTANQPARQTDTEVEFPPDQKTAKLRNHLNDSTKYYKWQTDHTLLTLLHTCTLSVAPSQPSKPAIVVIMWIIFSAANGEGELSTSSWRKRSRSLLGTDASGFLSIIKLEANERDLIVILCNHRREGKKKRKEADINKCIVCCYIIKMRFCAIIEERERRKEKKLT